MKPGNIPTVPEVKQKVRVWVNGNWWFGNWVEEQTEVKGKKGGLCCCFLVASSVSVTLVKGLGAGSHRSLWNWN